MPKYNNPRKTWQYSMKFKVRAVKVRFSPDIQVKQVAEGLGIHPFMLSRWRKEIREGLIQGDGKKRVGMTNIRKTAPAKQLSETLKLEKELNA
jgi:transposase